jgi:8-oxo-dGTP pyrophosphatase MutT (NUDIX family)
VSVAHDGGRALRLLGAGDPETAFCGDLEVARCHVEAALPVDAAAEATRKEMLAFVDAHPDALHRSCVEGHHTGSAMVVDPETRRFLFMLHAKVGRWLQPGGHADGDAALPGVALREATEETGIEGLRVAAPAIDLDVHRFEAAGEVSHLHFDVRYLVMAPPGAVANGNHESHGLRWAGIDELAELDLDAGTVRLASRALAVLALDLGG